MPFKQYKKIKRLGSEETEGILVGTVHVQEKIDGANTSIWLNEDGTLGKGSRTQDVSQGSFRGFVKYVDNHSGIRDLFNLHPKYRLYGEFLVPHTVHYYETSYNHFYLFDIEDENGLMIPTSDVNYLADLFKIERPQYFGTFENVSEEVLKELIGKSTLGDKGEGVVIKNPEFRNKFGDQQYAKIVSEKFKEDNAIVFGGNNKHSETYWEMFIVNKYITVARVQKIMNKLSSMVDHKLDKSDSPRIAGTVYYDYLTEEIFEIQKKVQSINFRILKNLSQKKAIKIYHDILNNFKSVAYENQSNNS